MYQTLRPELLTATERQKAEMKADPTTVVSWGLFEVNQFPYLEVRRPFILGLSEQKWKATLAHWFIALCHSKGLLRTLYTQNIDGLDYQTTLPIDKIIGVHGTLGKIACEFCHQDSPYPDFEAKVRSNIRDIYGTDPNAPTKSSNILCDSCGKPGLKPKTVLYGSAMPAEFFEHSQIDFPSNVDLLIVVGTSLTVGPANSLVSMVSPTCPRLIVNNEKVGEFLGIKYGPAATRDVFSSIGCDETFAQLISELGWTEDMALFVDKMAPSSQETFKKIAKK